MFNFLSPLSVDFANLKAKSLKRSIGLWLAPFKFLIIDVVCTCDSTVCHQDGHVVLDLVVLALCDWEEGGSKGRAVASICL